MSHFAFENKQLVQYNNQKVINNSNELANGVIDIEVLLCWLLYS